MLHKKAFALAALAVLALTLASCGGSAPPSGVDGIVLFAGGPMILRSPSPSPLPGGFGSGMQGRPYPYVAVQVTATSGADAGRVVARVKPDAQALFSVDLAPGGYVLKALDGRLVVSSREVTVRAGKRTRVIVRVHGR